MFCNLCFYIFSLCSYLIYFNVSHDDTKANTSAINNLVTKTNNHNTTLNSHNTSISTLINQVNNLINNGITKTTLKLVNVTALQINRTNEYIDFMIHTSNTTHYIIRFFIGSNVTTKCNCHYYNGSSYTNLWNLTS